MVTPIHNAGMVFISSMLGKIDHNNLSRIFRRIGNHYPEMRIEACPRLINDKGVGLEFLIQQLSNDLSHLLEEETRRRLFPPAVSLVSGTTWQSS